METVSRFFKAPKTSFFIFGPRGTGKSTWLKDNYTGTTWIDLLRPEVFRDYIAKPERLRDVIAGQSQKIVIIDEIQKVPQLLNEVHRLREERRDLKFILTGSSCRKLKKQGVNLLAGRALLKTMHPFMASELGKKFSLKRSLEQGLLPIVWQSENPTETLDAYTALYLKEEIQAEGAVRDIGGFSRFLEAMSFSQASVINLSHVARECQVEQKTAAGYAKILEDILISFLIPVFSKRAKRKLIAHAKFYYFDAGVFNALRQKGPLDKPEEMQGLALETLVAQNLRAWIAYSGNQDHLSFWRTRSGLEVDFIVYGKSGFWAIEVKNNKVIHPRYLRGLKEFSKEYPEVMPLLLYRGEEKLKIDGILCVPVESFLLQMHPERKLWKE